MTRGVLYVQFEGKVYGTIEFNGDMYIKSGSFEGHGVEIVEAFQKMKDWYDFYLLTEELNKPFQYPEQLIYLLDQEMVERELNFSKEIYMADYTYIINLDEDSAFSFIDKEGRTWELERGEFAVLCFGRLVKLN